MQLATIAETIGISRLSQLKQNLNLLIPSLGRCAASECHITLCYMNTLLLTVRPVHTSNIVPNSVVSLPSYSGKTASVPEPDAHVRHKSRMSISFIWSILANPIHTRHPPTNCQRILCKTFAAIVFALFFFLFLSSRQQQDKNYARNWNRFLFVARQIQTSVLFRSTCQARRVKHICQTIEWNVCVRTQPFAIWLRSIWIQMFEFTVSVGNENKLFSTIRHRRLFRRTNELNDSVRCPFPITVGSNFIRILAQTTVFDVMKTVWQHQRFCDAPIIFTDTFNCRPGCDPADKKSNYFKYTIFIDMNSHWKAMIWQIIFFFFSTHCYDTNRLRFYAETVNQLHEIEARSYSEYFNFCCVSLYCHVSCFMGATMSFIFALSCI